LSPITALFSKESFYGKLGLRSSLTRTRACPNTIFPRSTQHYTLLYWTALHCIWHRNGRTGKQFISCLLIRPTCFYFPCVRPVVAGLIQPVQGQLDAAVQFGICCTRTGGFKSYIDIFRNGKNPHRITILLLLCGYTCANRLNSFTVRS
jgi:hypothetical protein